MSNHVTQPSMSANRSSASAGCLYSSLFKTLYSCWQVSSAVNDCADNGVKFEGQSAYDSDFHAHPLERRAPMNPVPAARNTAKFDGTSTYHVSQTTLLAVCLRAFAPVSHLHCYPLSPVFTVVCLNHDARWWSLMTAIQPCFRSHQWSVFVLHSCQ